MTEIDDFAHVRPVIEPLDAATRSRLRADLFPPAVTAPMQSAVFTDGADNSWESAALPAVHRASSTAGPRRRTRVLAAAAAVAIIAGGVVAAAVTWVPSGGDLLAGEGRPDPSGSPARDLPAPIALPRATTTVPASDDGTVSLAPEPVPLLTIDQPGWSLTDASIRTEEEAGMVLADPQRGIDGPLITIGRSADGLSVYGDEAVDVTVNGEPGLLSGIDDVRVLAWHTAGGAVLRAESHGLDDSELLSLAAVVTVDADGQIELLRPIPGLVPADQASVTALSTYGWFVFSNNAGQTLQANAYPGGRYGHAIRVDNDEREPIMFHGEAVPLLDYGLEGRYRVNVVRGFWAWEFDGEPFANAQEFLDLIDRLVAIDEDTWHRSLPADIVTPMQRPAAAAEMAARLPVPDRFDLSALAERPVTDPRRALAEEVVTAVSCAWLETWIEADADRDRETARTATEALATVARSTVLQDAGVYGDGLSEHLAQLSATLLGLTEGTVPRSDDTTPERLRFVYPCQIPD